MITLPNGFLSVFAIAMVIAVACDSESTTVPTEAPMTEAPLTEATQTSDCPGCLLRERVASAQPGDTIDIAAGVYTMTGGELLIDKDLTLIGAGAEITVIQAADSLDMAVHRVIRITEKSVVTISGVTIRYGSEASTEVRMIPFHSEAVGMPSSGMEAVRAEFGGGIYNQGTLTLIDSIVSENYAGGGGGIFNGAKVIIENSAIRGNRSGGIVRTADWGAIQLGIKRGVEAREYRPASGEWVVVHVRRHADFGGHASEPASSFGAERDSRPYGSIDGSRCHGIDGQVEDPIIGKIGEDRLHARNRRATVARAIVVQIHDGQERAASIAATGHPNGI